MALHSQTHAVTHAAKSYIVRRKTGLAGASACQAARMSLPVFRAVEYGNIVTHNKAVNSLDLLLHLGAGRFTSKHNCIPSSQAEPLQMSSSLGILIVPARHSPFCGPQNYKSNAFLVSGVEMLRCIIAATQLCLQSNLESIKGSYLHWLCAVSVVRSDTCSQNPAVQQRSADYRLHQPGHLTP